MSGQLQIREVSLEEWSRLFPAPACIYDSAAFISLNAGKCDRLAILAATQERSCIGIAAGVRAGVLHAPFSAPFGAIETLGAPSPEMRLRFAVALGNYCRDLGLRIELTLPPGCYAPEEDALNREVMTEAGFLTIRADLNFHIPLHPVPQMIPTARNKASRARREDMRFEECPLSGLEEVYATIKRNREMKGFPLRMTACDLEATAPIASTRLFALRRASGEIAAAAIVYRSSPEAYQLIYWGHTDPAPGVMNLLASELTAALSADPSADLLDLGPASDCGHLLPGLARFKASLGAIPTVKPTFGRR